MSSFKNHILVPVDFSEQSLIAVGQSINFARLTKASLTFVYVIEEHMHLPFFSKTADKTLEKNIQKELSKLAKDTVDKFGVKTDTLIMHGKVYEELDKAAKKLKSSAIIMGTNGQTGLKRFIGSNALRVIRQAPCPVITIKGKKHRSGCKHILLPLDLSKETKEKVTRGIEIAQLYGSHINLMSVLTSDDEFVVKKLQRQMMQVEDFVKQHNVPCSHEFIIGTEVGEGIVKYAKKIKADLILIMTQQEMNWTNMFISSDAQEVINGTDVPVLSIRPMVRKDTTASVLY